MEVPTKLVVRFPCESVQIAGSSLRGSSLHMSCDAAEILRRRLTEHRFEAAALELIPATDDMGEAQLLAFAQIKAREVATLVRAAAAKASDPKVVMTYHAIAALLAGELDDALVRFIQGAK